MDSSFSNKDDDPMFDFLNTAGTDGQGSQAPDLSVNLDDFLNANADGTTGPDGLDLNLVSSFLTVGDDVTASLLPKYSNAGIQPASQSSVSQSVTTGKAAESAALQQQPAVNHATEAGMNTTPAPLQRQPQQQPSLAESFLHLSADSIVKTEPGIAAEALLSVKSEPSSDFLPATPVTEGFHPANFEFIPQITRILDAVASGNDRAHIARMVANLYQRLDQCQQMVQALPGADSSTQQQEERLTRERLALEKKTAQLEKYLSLPAFSTAASASPMATDQ
ncbi:hypothetical protein H4R35_006048 [Dimargaris xerosporica]|nr:hypothetical protein H4R35_006048 [Dimargaris xerosporica]